ncbi:MAG: VWA domain-containing protein [Cyanobacteria bacterium]|nr:VWA domain-containing protein [Cyanobacteriota bacterium]
MSSDLKSWLACIVITAATAAATARAQPVFRSGVDLITVDAAVLDGDGRPVPSLSAEDFRIDIDGRPRRVVSAQFVDLSAPINTPIVPAATHFSSNAWADDGRIVVVAVDEAHIRRLEGRPALAAASRFIDGLPANDRIGVIGLTSAAGVTLTRDRVALRNRLGTLLGNGDSLSGRFNLGISEALEIADGGRARLADAVLRECGRALTEYVSAARAADDAVGRDSCPEQLEQESRGIAQHAHAQARISLAALEALIARLKELPGPKTIVLLSEGMIVDARRTDVSKLAADAQAARVTIYALLLETPLFDATQERVSPADPRDRQVRSDGIDQVAGAARGAVFRLVASDPAPFARITRELSGQYLLAFEAADSDRDARAHRIRVTLTRGRQVVRARTHFTLPAAAAPARGAQLSALLRTLSPANELPLGVATYTYAEPSRHALRVVISAQAGSGEKSTAAWLGFVLIDAAGVVAATATIDSSSGHHAFSCVVPEGRYTLRAAAIDPLGRQGSVERVFSARLGGTTELRITDLMLAPVPATPAEPLSPIVDRASGDAIVAYVEFQSMQSRPADVRFEIARGPSEPALQSLAAAVSMRGDGWAMARAVIPIGGLAPGVYVARADIGAAGAPSGAVTRPFTISR